MRKNKTITLIEVIIGAVLIGALFMIVGTISFFFVSNIIADMDSSNMHNQVNYALEDIKIRCITAANVDSGSFFSINETKDHLDILGEKDIYVITPNELDDNVWYSYYVDGSGDFILEEQSDPVKREVLVESRFSPEIEFTYREGDEPNFLVVTLNTTNPRNNKESAKEEGLRFWFIDVVK